MSNSCSVYLAGLRHVVVRRLCLRALSCDQSRRSQRQTWHPRRTRPISRRSQLRDFKQIVIDAGRDRDWRAREGISQAEFIGRCS